MDSDPSVEAEAAAAALTAERTKRERLTWDDEDEYTDWLNSLMENAPEDFDGDEAMEAIVKRYIVHLESESAKSRELVEALEKIAESGLLGRADEHIGDPLTNALAKEVVRCARAALAASYGEEKP